MATRFVRTPRGYSRQSFSDWLTLYQDPRVEPPREKNLLVAFGTNAGRLMMPICVFLQFMDFKSWDVALLKKPTAALFCAA